MKFLACLSLSTDVYSDVRVDEVSGEPVFDEASLTIGPLDKQVLAKVLNICPEAAAVGVCGKERERALRYSAAMGVKHLFRINDCSLDSYVAAERISGFLKDHPADVVLCGMAGWDYASGDFPGWLSSVSGIGLIEDVSDFSVSPQGELLVRRQTEEKELLLRVRTPVILACNKSVFPQEQVPIPSMREMMTALRSPVGTVECSGWVEPKKRFFDFRPVPPRPPIRFFLPEDTGALADILASACNGGGENGEEKETGRVTVFSGRLTARTEEYECPDPMVKADFEIVQELPTPVHRDLKDAPVVIAGGMGVDDEAWGLIGRLAEATGAAIGCTRPVYYLGRRPYYEHVGQTGAKIAPGLYVAVGISGALQHVAGIVRSGKILAINSDPEAEIFKYADYGVVGDAADVLRGILSAVEKDERYRQINR